MPETTIAQALQVSRGTVRDAFRTLMGEHLLTYEMHKGVTVRWLTGQDVQDIYALRRTFEVTAIERVEGSGRSVSELGLEQAVLRGEQAAGEQRWLDVGTDNTRFHNQLVAALDSPRTDQFFTALMTELRLGFLAIVDAATFHHTYLVRNRQILDLIASSNFAGARAELTAYLCDAEQRVVEALGS